MGLRALAELVYRRRGRVVIAWVLALVAVLGIAPQVGGSYRADYSTPGSDSQAAESLLSEGFGKGSAYTISAVWEARGGARGPIARARIHSFLTRAGRLPGIGAPLPTRVAPDGKIAISELQLDEAPWDVPKETGERMISLAEEDSGHGLAISLSGGPIQTAEGGQSPEGLGFLAAAIVLLIAFGSIVAAGLPLAAALFGLGISSSLILLLALVVDVPEWTPAVAGLMGIGVGIDYALLVLTRFRVVLAEGGEPHEAVVEAVTTAGRSVLIAGSTVVISLLGLFLVGVTYLHGVALSASIAVLVVMVAALTLVPALLGFAGRRIDRLRIPGLRSEPRLDDAAPAARWVRMIQRRPWVALVISVVVLLALAAPTLGLRLGFPDEGNDASGTTTREAYDRASEGFGPGSNGPLIVAVELPSAKAAASLPGAVRQMRGTPGVVSVAPPRIGRSRDVAEITVISAASPQSERTEELVGTLRDEVLPAAFAGSGARPLLGGSTASFVDQSGFIESRLPILIAGVVLLSFLLLLVAFRSPLIAAKAGVMNLLSVGAAYGVVSVFAAGGFAGELIGIDRETPVAPFIPVMMFAILFGLSMDYEVFLISRVREEYLRCGDTGAAVAQGVARTARVISAAAAIMVVVFLAFLVSPTVFLKLLGIGMATAILVDATIVRMVLVPALMQLFGRANWWIPGWLDRFLPHLDPEPTAEGTES